MTSASPVPETSPTPPADEPDEISAGPGRYYRRTRYLVSIVLLIGGGSWFFWDGFVAWPRQRALARELEAQGKHADVRPHSDLDIQLNQAIGLTVPPLGLALLAWTLYNSRGRYRLSGNTLYVPGHPPVPLEAIRQIDKTRWERKGIAWIDYELPGGPAAEPADADAPATGRLKLDDFVYEQEKTDAILERIEQVIAPAVETPSVEAPAEGEPAEPAEGELTEGEPGGEAGPVN